MNFNEWSQRRRKLGVKQLTSRKESHADDPDVLYEVGPLPWGFIRDFLYRGEGAVCPLELQGVINGIFRRVVSDDELFYVDVLKEEENRPFSY